MLVKIQRLIITKIRDDAMPFIKIDRIIAAVAMLAFCCTPPLRAEIIVLDDKTVMQGRIGKLEDDIVKFPRT